MIKRYSDHAANERTFLAWVRTAIAVMAFGFIIERFDLFVRVAAPQLAQRQLGTHGEGFANWAGLIFIIIGISSIAVAWLRFSRTKAWVRTSVFIPAGRHSRVNATGSYRQAGADPDALFPARAVLRDQVKACTRFIAGSEDTAVAN